MKALDTETYLLRPGRVAPKMVVGQVANDVSTRLLYPGEVRDFLLRTDRNCEEVAFAFAPFDLAVSCAMFPELIDTCWSLLRKGLVRDTHIRQALLDLGRGTFLIGADGTPLTRYSLQNVAEKVLGVYVAKATTPRLFYAHLDGVAHELWPQDAKDYALKDARVTYDVVEKQREGAVDDPGILNLLLEPENNRANFALYLMSCWGVRTDKAMVEDVAREAQQKHDEMVAKFTDAGIFRGEEWCRNYSEPFTRNPEPHKCCDDTCKPWPASQVGTKDTKWLKELVRRAYSNDPPTTKTEGVSTSRDTLLESGNDLLMALGESGADETVYKTYVDAIRRGVDVPINGRYDPIKRTLRTGMGDPNLQNPPRIGRVRECVVARPGTVLVSVDYPSQELVTLGETLLRMFGQSELANGLNAGKDLHVLVASRVLGLTYEEGFAQKKAKDPKMKVQRQSAKITNYGSAGGMGPEKLVIFARQPANDRTRFCGQPKCLEHYVHTFNSGEKAVLCPDCVAKARVFRRAWLNTFPEMQQYFDYISLETEDWENNVIELPGPVGEPTLYVRGRRFSEAANIRFQSLAARMSKDAISRVSEACYTDRTSPLYDSRPVLFLHDEVIVEVPEHDHVTEAAYEVARHFREAAQHWCPNIRCEPEPALMRRWFKAAEKAVGKDGKLRCWWPPDAGGLWDWAADQEQMRKDCT
jgi:DNA polymerase-1